MARRVNFLTFGERSELSVTLRARSAFHREINLAKRDVEPSSYILQRTTTSTTAHPALLYTQDARPGLSTSVGRSAFRVTDFSRIPELYSPQIQRLLLREKEELQFIALPFCYTVA